MVLVSQIDCWVVLFSLSFWRGKNQGQNEMFPWRVLLFFSLSFLKTSCVSRLSIVFFFSRPFFRMFLSLFENFSFWFSLKSTLISLRFSVTLQHLPKIKSLGEQNSGTGFFTTKVAENQSRITRPTVSEHERLTIHFASSFDKFRQRCFRFYMWKRGVYWWTKAFWSFWDIHGKNGNDGLHRMMKCSFVQNAVSLSLLEAKRETFSRNLRCNRRSDKMGKEWMMKRGNPENNGRKWKFRQFCTFPSLHLSWFERKTASFPSVCWMT